MSEQKLSPPPIPVAAPAAPSLRPPVSSGAMSKAGVLPLSQTKAVEHEQISLVGESESRHSKIQAYGIAKDLAHQSTWKRQTKVTGSGAIRVRTFHGRLSDEGLAFMDEKINQWIDERDDVEIKQVTTTIGIYESKSKDPALIVNIWY
jgi:hypothetical protein